MTRVLLVSHDPIGRRMAGPGIRYLHFARELARGGFEVVLMVPGAPDIELDGIEVLQAARFPSRRFVRLASGFDAVVAQQLAPWTMRALARTDAKVVYDLYDPLLIETLPLFAEHAGGHRESGYGSVARTQLVALATGDAFVCASERQRDLWLGALAALGRIDVASYAADPTLRGLVDVVPFGLEAEPPAPGPPALKGVVPGIEEGDRVLLWAGGIWSWFDPLTVIHAVGRLARDRDDVKLYFLGTRHPKPSVGEMPMAARAAGLAAELGLLDRHVFFNRGWVDYAERGRYLLESDLGVSAHFDNAETRFAFRTRLLDHFWAGLPTVTTRGDVLAGLVGEQGLGAVVPYEDPGAYAEAIAGLLDDGERYGEARRNLERVRAELAWPAVVRRLAAVVGSPAAVRPARGSARLVLESSWLGLRSSLGEEGARATVVRALEAIRHPRVP
ncbi:MAG TPA: glycosyltransferase [Gaiellaceae bacterium]|nr:glycosyltransferase [Gaiellaceae bacterium]